MKKGGVLRVLCVAIMASILFAGNQASAQTQVTALEKTLYQSALKEGELNWWDQNSLKEISIFMNAFNKKFPGLKINYFEGTTDVNLEKYFTEHKAGRARVDILAAGSHLPFKDRDLLTDLSDIIKDSNYPLQFCTKELTGVTQDFGVYGVAYNTNLVAPKDVPRSLEDLLDPKWTGKVNVESRLKVLIFGTEHWGEKWIVEYLKKLRAQRPTFNKGDTATMTLLAAGEFPISISAYLHNILTQQETGSPVTFAPINPAITGGTSPTIVPKTAPHPNAAKLLLRWMISPEGQVITDKIKKKGYPVPGSGTVQSKAIEKLGISVFGASTWAFENQTRLEKIYGQAVGFR